MDFAVECCEILTFRRSAKLTGLPSETALPLEHVECSLARPSTKDDMSEAQESPASLPLKFVMRERGATYLQVF